ncbi:hypothetical protein HAX54_035405 [Datura stramonium]|uniref:Uncharacterized protein n=1 Tax=Datura stramonium TaxID=4076 RepID=A0ABS8VF97_DATST|nr:hypothetical protein [Datura stramonium]
MSWLDKNLPFAGASLLIETSKPREEKEGGQEELQIEFIKSVNRAMNEGIPNCGQAQNRSPGLGAEVGLLSRTRPISRAGEIPSQGRGRESSLRLGWESSLDPMSRLELRAWVSDGVGSVVPNFEIESHIGGTQSDPELGLVPTQSRPKQSRAPGRGRGHRLVLSVSSRSGVVVRVGSRVA